MRHDWNWSELNEEIQCMIIHLNGYIIILQKYAKSQFHSERHKSWATEPHAKLWLY